MRLVDIVRKGTASIVAAAMLSAGCATNTSRKVIRQYPDELPRVGVLSRSIESFDDILEVNISGEELFTYTYRLNEIRNKINSNINYNPQSDLRRLLLDVERSSFDSRLEFSHALRNYGYEREFEITESYGIDERYSGSLGLLLTIGGILALYSLSEEDAQKALLPSIGVGLTFMIFFDRVKDNSRQVYRERTRYVPLAR